ERFGPSAAMAAVTSVMRAQQILLAELDGLLRPRGLTFARYEALVLLAFSRRGALPLRVIGERLMVHPTSVTNTINRLDKQGLGRALPGLRRALPGLRRALPGLRRALPGLRRALPDPRRLPVQPAVIGEPHRVLAGLGRDRDALAVARHPHIEEAAGR